MYISKWRPFLIYKGFLVSRHLFRRWQTLLSGLTMAGLVHNALYLKPFPVLLSFGLFLLFRHGSGFLIFFFFWTFLKKKIAPLFYIVVKMSLPGMILVTRQSLTLSPSIGISASLLGLWKPCLSFLASPFLLLSILLSTVRGRHCALYQQWQEQTWFTFS